MRPGDCIQLLPTWRTAQPRALYMWAGGWLVGLRIKLARLKYIQAEYNLLLFGVIRWPRRYELPVEMNPILSER
jgi:hypothetical protein